MCIDSHYLLILIFFSLKYFSISIYDKFNFSCCARLFFVFRLGSDAASTLDEST